MGLFKKSAETLEKEKKEKSVNELKAIISETLVKIQKLDMYIYNGDHNAYSKKFEEFTGVIKLFYSYLDKWTNFKLDEEGVKNLSDFLSNNHTIEKKFNDYSQYFTEIRKNVESGKEENEDIFLLVKGDIIKIFELFKKLGEKIEEIKIIFISDINKNSNLVKVYNTKKYGVPDPKNYIVLPGRSHEDYSYPDLLISKDLFYKGKNWFEAHKLLQKDGFFMLTIRQFIDFLILINSENVINGDGNKINQEELQNIKNSIYFEKSKYGIINAEWLDAKFENKNKEMWIYYNNRIKNGELITQNIEKISSYLEHPMYIDFKILNKQGIPRLHFYGKEGYYTPPAHNTVAVFEYSSFFTQRVWLNCARCSTYGGSVSVRRAKVRLQ